MLSMPPKATLYQADVRGVLRGFETDVIEHARMVAGIADMERDIANGLPQHLYYQGFLEKELLVRGADERFAGMSAYVAKFADTRIVRRIFNSTYPREVLAKMGRTERTRKAAFDRDVTAMLGAGAAGGIETFFNCHVKNWAKMKQVDNPVICYFCLPNGATESKAILLDIFHDERRL